MQRTSEKELYFGELSADETLQNGIGVKKERDGSIYYGGWNNGLREGFGILCESDGGMRVGTWTEDQSSEVICRLWPSSSGLMLFMGTFKNIRPKEGTLFCKNGRVYHGIFTEWRKEEFDGEGVLVWPNQRIYGGRWKNGGTDIGGVIRRPDKADGRLIGTLSNVRKGFVARSWSQESEKQFFYGIASDDEVRNSNGILFYREGEFYAGEMSRGQRTGTGIYRDTDMSVYFGNWSNNSLEGEGIYVSLKDSIIMCYIGSFSDGKFDGQGCLVQRVSGEWDFIYSGTWKNNQKSGIGVLNEGAGQFYIGGFKSDLKDGVGENILEDGSKVGMVWENGIHDKGEEIKADTETKVSEELVNTVDNNTFELAEFAWEDQSIWNKMPYYNGFYSVECANGDYYDGEWSKGKFHGTGVYKWKDGKMYEGEWKDGIPNGKGRYIYSNGDVYEGYFLNGEIAKEGKLAIVGKEPFIIDSKHLIYKDENPAVYPIFNSIINNSTFGDERDFVRIEEKHSGHPYSSEIVIEAGKQYEVYIYYRNDASERYNKKEQGYTGVARDVRLACYFPDKLKANERAAVTGKITASNTFPKTVCDQAYITAKQSMTLHYVIGSAKIYNKWNEAGTVLSTKLFSSIGTFIGLSELNGVILGGSQYAGYIVYTIQTQVDNGNNKVPIDCKIKFSDVDKEDTVESAANLEVVLMWEAAQNAEKEGNIQEAIKLYEVIKDGAEYEKRARMSLAKLYSDQPERVFQCYYRAASLGDSYGQLAVGNMYLCGKGVALNYDEAMRWFKMSAAQGDSAALFYVGNMYENGLGIPFDRNEAIKWYRKAAEKGHAGAEDRLLIMPETMEEQLEIRIGRRISEEVSNEELAEFDSIIDSEEAATWLEKHIPNYRIIVAEETNKQKKCLAENAQKEMAEGEICEKKRQLEEAFRHYYNAADLGDAKGAFYVGYMYERGEGVQKNIKSAVEWYTKAANMGNRGAQHNLGFFYYSGTGVKQNFKLAYEFFMMAAKQGKADSMLNIGVMYENGEYVAKDYNKALEWYQRAENNGNSDGGRFYKTLQYKMNHASN